MSRTLYLASRSPRRAALIRLIGVRQVHIRPADLDEQMDPKLTPAENVRALAVEKSTHLARSLATTQDAHGIVLGADTTVVIDGTVLNKPADAAEARAMLQQLSGRTHSVFTGVALTDSASLTTHSFVEETRVTFRDLTVSEIDAYVATGAPLDKAGAYGIQEDFGAVFVSRIEGDYYTVVGLPISRLYLELKAFAPDLW